MKPTSLATALVLVLSACKSQEKLDPAHASDAQYPEGMAAVWKAVISALGDLDLKVDSDHHDALGGRVVAVRATGEKVVIEARTLTERSTQVSVALGTVDRNMAQVIQTSIARSLAATATAAEFFGGNSLEGAYENSLAACVLAAERAFESLGLEITQRTVQDSRAEIVSRKSKATPVLIRMEANGRAPLGKAGQADGDGDVSAEKGRIHVTFVAGTTRSPENEPLVKRVKSEFERLLR